MTLDAIFMPKPFGAVGRFVEPLGAWEEDVPSDDSVERRRAQWRKYADKRRDQRAAYIRDWRARQSRGDVRPAQGG